MRIAPPLRALLYGLILSAAVFGQTTISVDKLVEFIRSAISMKSPDKQVAAYVTHLKLSQKLDERTIEQLRGEGAGPRTVAARRDLAAASASLTQAPKVEAVKAPPPIPPPPYEDQQTVIAQAREYAHNYSSSLPNFICTQVTRRYYGQNGHENWHLADTLTSKLSYFEQHEKYELKLINSQLVDRPYESLGGASSSGEFGTMLKQTFDERTGAEFHWDHWGTLRGHLVYVFNYHVDRGNSQWMLDYEHREQIQPAYEGLVYLDKETGKVLRLTLRAVELPPAFPIQDAHTQLDYDYTDIGGQKFLLPLVAQVRMRHDNILTRNDNEFRLYRKYGVESSITFTPDALDESKIQENPPK